MTEMKTDNSRAEHERRISTLMEMQTQNSTSKQELLKAMKDAFSIGWENKKMICEIEKKVCKMVNDLQIDHEQVMRRDHLEIQEKVRMEMYDQIKQHNISRNKIMSQTKDHIISVMNAKIEEIENFETLRRKDDSSIKVFIIDFER